MWKPPIELRSEELSIAQPKKKGRKFFIFVRDFRHELFDEEFQRVLTAAYSPGTSGKDPVKPGLLAAATLLQAYCGVSDREAVERASMDKRWQMVLDCLGEDEAPFSQSTLWEFRMRMIEHNLDKVLLERSVELAERTGGFGARALRVALDSSPLFGAARVEDTFNLLGHALLKAVNVAAKELDRPREELLEEAGLELVGKSSVKAALDLDWGQAKAREQALGLVLEELQRWEQWLEKQRSLSRDEPPMKEAMKTIEQIVEQDTEPDPEGGSKARRIKKEVAKDRRISIEDPEMRHGRKSKSSKFNGFKQHIARDLDSKVIREVVVRPANEAEHEAVALFKEELEKGKGLYQLDVDLGYMGSPQIQQWYDQGVHIIARPWPLRSELFTKADFHIDFEEMTLTCPGGQKTSFTPGKLARFGPSGCDQCSLRAQCTKAKPGRGRSVKIAQDEELQRKLRAKSTTSRGRSSLRKRVDVEHAISHHVSTQGRKARYIGTRKNQFDGRRHAAVQNLFTAARYIEEERAA